MAVNNIFKERERGLAVNNIFKERERGLVVNNIFKERERGLAVNNIFKETDKNAITFSASITVEMSYILPTIILLLVLTINTVFYFHDKNILIGGAAETAVLGAQMERQRGEKADLQSFFQERISGKLILLRLTGIEIKSEKKWFKVTACAQKGRMQLCAEQKAAIAKPEKKIREKRKLESLLNKEEKITNENGL